MKRNVIADIEQALRKGCSPFSLQDVLKAQSHGNLQLLIGRDMTASFWKRNGALEIVHVAGRWNDTEARAMYDAFQREARRQEIPAVWSGRGGWRRFLKMKGFTE